MQSLKKILFISHDSALTGAPIALLNLLRLVKEKNVADFEVLLYRGGVLENEFKALGRTFIFKDKFYALEKKFIKRVFNFLKVYYKSIAWRKKVKEYDFAFVNTVAKGSFLKSIRSKKEFILYVHELEDVIKFCNKKKNATYLINEAAQICCPSNEVLKNLVKNHKVNPEKLRILNYYIPFNPNESPDKQIQLNSFLSKYNIPDGKFYVVSMGSANHRKGIDLFIQTCIEVTKSDKNIAFVWIGDFVDVEEKKRINNLIIDNNLTQYVFITGYLKHNIYALQPFNVFYLSSREDPYPLVVLEAAFNKLPTIMFNGSGGMVEFVYPDCGWLADNFSISQVAEKIIELKNRQNALQISGENAFYKAMQLHGNKNRIIDQFQSVIND